MTEKTMSINVNLEARQAAMLVQIASKFASEIRLEIEERSVNGKSIMGIISLGLLDGQTLKISAQGEDSDEAVNGLENYLASLK